MMNKLDRLFFDIGCIIMIIILPYFVLEKTGIVDYVARSKQKGLCEDENIVCKRSHERENRRGNQKKH